MSKKKTAFLTVRVNESTRQEFIAKVQKYGQPSEVLRELIEAFTEDRIVITPPTNQKESLYVSRS